MPKPNAHPERHLVGRIGWLRAAVLGAMTVLFRPPVLIVGVAAAAAGRDEVLLAGVAGLWPGRCRWPQESMFPLVRKRTPRRRICPVSARNSRLPGVRTARTLIGLSKARIDKATADKVAAQLTAKDPLGAHARDELSITHITTARPIQAALTSAATFTAGASLPLLAAWLLPFGSPMIVGVSAASLLFLAMLGAIGAKAGGALWGRQRCASPSGGAGDGHHCRHRQARGNRCLDREIPNKPLLASPSAL